MTQTWQGKSFEHKADHILTFSLKWLLKLRFVKLKRKQREQEANEGVMVPP